MNQERWNRFAIRDQIGHMTSELSRAAVWEKRADLKSRDEALSRALELVSMTLSSVRGARRREIARFKEMICHCLVRSRVYDIELRDLEVFGLRHFGC